MSGKRKRSNQPTLGETRAKAQKIDHSLSRTYDEHNELSLRLKGQIPEEKFKDIKQMFNGRVGRRELDEMGDFCELFNCLFDHDIIQFGEYKKLKKALHAVGLHRLKEEIKKTSATIRKIQRRNTSNPNNKRREIRVKREWNTVRGKWSRIAAELFKRSRIKLLKKNFDKMTEFFDGMHTVMERKVFLATDLDVKLEIRSYATGAINETLDRHFTETALTDTRALKRATRVFVDRYNAFLIKAARGCLQLTLRFTTSSALEMMWNDYLSGDLSNRLTDTIVTIPMKEMADWEDVFVGVKIDKGHYLNVCRYLLSGMNFFEKMSCKSTDDTKEDDDNTPIFDSGNSKLSSHVAGETSQVETDGWGRRQQHLCLHQKRCHTEVNVTTDRPLSIIPGDENEHKFDTNKETKRCLQHTARPAIASVNKCHTGEISQVDTDGCENVLENLIPDQKWGQPEANFLMERPLSCEPRDPLEILFDAIEKTKSSEQLIAAVTAKGGKHAMGFDKTTICEDADDAKEDDETGFCFDPPTLKLPSLGEKDQVFGDGLDHLKAPTVSLQSLRERLLSEAICEDADDAKEDDETGFCFDPATLKLLPLLKLTFLGEIDFGDGLDLLKAPTVSLQSLRERLLSEEKPPLLSELLVFDIKEVDVLQLQKDDAGNIGLFNELLNRRCSTSSMLIRGNKSLESFLFSRDNIGEINSLELVTQYKQQKRNKTVRLKEALKRHQNQPSRERHLTTNKTGLVILMACYGKKAKRTKTSF